jgi:hypothetical protein
MTNTSQKLLLWAPRIAGVLVASFLALFAFDAFNESSFASALPAFAIHLIPSLLVLAVVGVAWKFEWIGAVAFVAFAILYGVMVRGRLDWMAAISGPLLLVGVLFLASWRHQAALHRNL